MGPRWALLANVVAPARPYAGPTLLRGREASVDERFVQIQIAFVVHRLRENFEDAPQ